MRPLGLLLLRKRLHTNLLILAAKKAVEDAPLELDSVPQRQVLALVDHLLARLDRHLGVSRNRLRQLERLLHQRLVCRERPRGNPPPLSLGTGEGLARQDELHGLGLAHRACQALAAAGSRDGAQLDLGLAKVGVLSAVNEVAHHGKLAAATQCVARDGGNDGLLDLRRQQRPRLDERLGIRLGEGQRRHLLNICARRKRLLRAGEDNNGGVVGGIEVVERLVELVDERGAEGVERLGSVQSDFKRSAWNIASSICPMRTLANAGLRGRDLDVLVGLGAVSSDNQGEGRPLERDPRGDRAQASEDVHRDNRDKCRVSFESGSSRTA